MKTETLQALLIDRELGELPSDVAELLDAYVEAAPSARHELAALSRTIRTAQDTVRQFPELSRAGDPVPSSRIVPMPRLAWRWLARAAAVVALVGFGAGVGYLAAVRSNLVAVGDVAKSSAPDARATHVDGASANSPWARYEVAFDRRTGGFTIARQP